MKKILVIQSIHEAGIELLKSNANYEFEVVENVDPEFLKSKIKDFDGVSIRTAKLTRDVIEAANNLKIISRHGVGYDNIDLEASKKNNLTLAITATANAVAVAEHVMFMLLNISKRKTMYDDTVKEGKFNDRNKLPKTVELWGKNILIAGFGRIGQSLIKRCLGFEMKVFVYDPFVSKDVIENLGGIKVDSMEDACKTMDAVSLHIPLNDKTKNIINYDLLKTMKNNCIIINAARGGIVNEVDLDKALNEGLIFGAGLDVLEYEKLSFENLFDEESKNESFEYLRQSENVLLTPHVAGWTFESHEKLAQTIVDKIECLFSEKPKEEPKLKRVTGLGGFFFKTQNPQLLKEWYKKHLDLPVDDYGCSFWWKNEKGENCSTQWSPFKDDTNYFNPSKKEFMQNFRVDDLENLLKKLSEEGVTIIGEMETYEYGKFGWVLDLEGNKIELWEPIDSAFK